MRTLTGLSRLFLIFILALPLATRAQLTAKVNHEKIGTDDSVNVIFTYKGEDAKSFVADYDDFIKLRGPFMSQNRSTVLKDGKYVNSTTIEWTSTLKPKHKGKLTIEPAVVKTNDGTAVKSNSVEVEVVDGSIINEEEPDPNDFFGKMKSMTQRMKQASMKYTITAGPVHYHIGDSAKAHAATLTAIDMVMKLGPDFEPLGDQRMSGLPRKVFGVNDTSKARQLLATAYGLDTQSNYETRIYESKGYNPFSEEVELGCASRFYQYTDYLSGAATAQGAVHEARDLYIGMSFRSTENRGRFMNFIAAHGYGIAKSYELPSTIGHTYVLRISKHTTLERPVLDAMAGYLIGISPQYQASYLKMSIVNE